MHGDGLTASTIQNTLNPLQVICRRALHDGELASTRLTGYGSQPCAGGATGSPRRRRPQRSSRRSPWPSGPCGPRRSTRGYAVVSLRALRWSDVDFDAGVIRVERGWDDDPKVGEIAVKSDAADARCR